MPPATTGDPELPRRVLDAFTVLEVLSPQGFRRPEDLVGGDRRRLAPLEPNELPWAGEGERSNSGFHLYYQVILGTVDLEPAVGRLLEKFSDRRAERPQARGEAIVAAFTLDRDGRLVDSPAAVVASFAWGLPRALAGDLGSLARWPDEEGKLEAALEERLRRHDEDGKELALDRRTIEAAWRWLAERLGLPAELVRGPRLALRCFESPKSAAPPDPLLLSSFYLDDLDAAGKLFDARTPPATLAAYFGLRPPPERIALLEDDAALAAAVAPPLFPPARWPGAGRHPLNLLQQAAVNLGPRRAQGEPAFRDQRAARHRQDHLAARLRGRHPGLPRRSDGRARRSGRRFPRDRRKDAGRRRLPQPLQGRPAPARLRDGGRLVEQQGGGKRQRGPARGLGRRRVAGPALLQEPFRRPARPAHLGLRRGGAGQRRQPLPLPQDLLVGSRTSASRPTWRRRPAFPS